MNPRMKYYLVGALACLAAAAVLLNLSGVLSVSRAAGSGATPPGEKAAVGSLQTKLLRDGRKLDHLLRGAAPTALFTDAILRGRIGPKIVPILWDIVTRVDSFSKQFPGAAAHVRYLKYHYLALLELLGNARAAARLKAALRSKSKTTVLAAQLGRLEVQWWQNVHHAAGQQAVLQHLRKLVRQDPTDDDFTAVVYSMFRGGAADHAIALAVRHILLHELKGPLARAIQSSLEGPRRQQALLNKPLVISGPTITGKKFSSAQWKGKVVVVDFWGTWCPWCRRAIPHLESLYAKYHKRGFDLLSVSNDQSRATLRNYLKAHPQMVWPQIYDPAMPAKYNIEGFPTQFVIDRGGVLRDIVVGYNPKGLTRDVTQWLNPKPVSLPGK